MRCSASIAYIDANTRLDVADVRNQIRWYRAQKFLGAKVDGDRLIDRRYVRPLD